MVNEDFKATKTNQNQILSSDDPLVKSSYKIAIFDNSIVNLKSKKVILNEMEEKNAFYF